MLKGLTRFHPFQGPSKVSVSFIKAGFLFLKTAPKDKRVKTFQEPTKTIFLFLKSWTSIF